MSEFQSTTSPKIGRYTAVNFKDKQVKYSVINGMAVFEGDIVLGKASTIKADNSNLSSKGVAHNDPRFRWLNGEVPYHIDPRLPNPDRVTAAIAHWVAHTNVHFILLDGSTMNGYPDRVYFTVDTNCSSQVGKQGGEQLITLADGCLVGNVIHEIGHTVGLWHEQSREDRDRYVSIKYENIVPGWEHNFDQQITDGDDIGDYDYSSIMHYPATAFSKNNQPTIVAKNGVAIGQRNGLSDLDIKTVNTLYPRA